MSSEYHIDANGCIDDGPRSQARSRDEVLPDYRLHQLLDSEINLDINEALEEDVIVEALPDNRVYFINKTFYHTNDNTSVADGTAYKINEGPDNMGEAGDIDVGFLDLSSGKLRRIELKSPGRIPERHVREKEERGYPRVREGEKQNSYLAKLLDHYENETGRHVPYSPRVEVWNDVVEGEIQDINAIPKYSQQGHFVATDKAIDWAESSEMIEEFNYGFFKGWMFGGGEDILEEMGFK